MIENKDGVKVGGIFKFECYDKTGKLKWVEEAHNLVVNQGCTHINNILFAGGAQVNPWFIGLMSGSPTPAAGDTLASHAGWTEVAAYTGDRKEFVDVVSGGSVTNSASVAAFAINADGTTIGGGFFASVSSGTSGTLLSAVAFTGGNKTADSGDTLNVTYTWTTADDAA